VTNAQFLRFVQSGGYECRDFWTEEDWAWRAGMSLEHPLSWIVGDNGWFCRTLFEDVPLAEGRDWPVSVSLAEARAYARWAGGRIPTEAEFHRAAYSDPTGRERPHPWGDDSPSRDRGNFDFNAWAPAPAGSHPKGVSAWGVHELVGNGWEWTETVFAPFPGFRAHIPTYPGYSADFFDGKHYVLKGASWATDKTLLRRSFRNWYQARYPYVFTKFRCVRPAD
jgi:formylglycine-generating enzyme required for sulfatase activity